MPEYQLKLNGFRVLKGTADNLIAADGWGDELQIDSIVTVIDGAGKIVGVSEKTTPVMGDVNRPDNKVRAGTAGNNGGLKTGDSFPDTPMPWLPATPVSPERDWPPLVLWRDNLPEDNSRSVIIAVTPLEYDPENGQEFFTLLTSVLKNQDDQFGQRAKSAFGAIWPVAAPFFDAVSVGIQTAAALPRFLGNPGTRPIGMTVDPGNPNQYVYHPRMLALTAQNAKEIAESNFGLNKPGVFSYQYADPQSLGGGTYQLFFQLEDMSNPPPSWTSIGRADRIVALSRYNDHLVAINDNRRMFLRPFVEADIGWTTLAGGVAPSLDPAGFAIDSDRPAYYCATRDNSLYAALPWLGGALLLPWTRIGHANAVTAMAFAAGRLFCSTSDNQLWMRSPDWQDVGWVPIGHANNVVAMSARGLDLVCATVDRVMWSRPANNADVNWTVIGKAPDEVTGIANDPTGNSLWVTTRSGRLWKFQP